MARLKVGLVAGRNYVLLLAINTLYTGLCGMWIMFLPLYASQDLGFSKTALGLLYTASGAAALIGNMAGGMLADGLGRKKTVMVGFSVSALALAAMLLPGRTPVYTGFPMFFLAIGLASPAVHALTLESSPQKMQGTLYMLAVRVAPSLPPLATLPLAGYLYEQGMYSLLLVIGVASLTLPAAAGHSSHRAQKLEARRAPARTERRY